MVGEKRPLEADGAQEQEAAEKRPRTEPDPLKPSKPPKPGISMEALAKAKKVLELQAKLKEKIKNVLPQQAPPPPTAAINEALDDMFSRAKAVAASFASAPIPPSQAPGFRAAPLRLDTQGRELNEQGNVVERPAVVAALKVNQSLVGGSERRTTLPPPPLDPQAELEADPGFDARMAAGKAGDRKKRSTFEFVQKGTFQKQAEMMRLKAKFGDAAMKKINFVPMKGPLIGSSNPNLVPLGAPTGDPNQVPLGARKEFSEEDATGQGDAPAEEDFEPPPPADAEWWDKPFLSRGSYEADVSDEGASLKPNKITIYIEHPIPLEPPAEAPPPPPQPLKLTKKEMKKLRTQRRQAREKEKQDLIRQGLLEPPKPKVKIANLYRVLGEQAVADPTAMEKEARKQMAERQAAHDDRNLSRMLTPAERREKKLKKLLSENKASEIICTVYRISRIDNKQNQYKIDVNAKENHMSGVMLLSSPFCLVIVEGSPKSTQRYMKLMLRRIDWTLEGEEDPMEEDQAREPPVCDLVWQGVVKLKTFKV